MVPIWARSSSDNLGDICVRLEQKDVESGSLLNELLLSYLLLLPEAGLQGGQRLLRVTVTSLNVGVDHCDPLIAFFCRWCLKFKRSLARTWQELHLELSTVKRAQRRVLVTESELLRLLTKVCLELFRRWHSKGRNWNSRASFLRTGAQRIWELSFQARPFCFPKRAC